MEAMLVLLEAIFYILQYRQPEKPFYRPQSRILSRIHYLSEDYGFGEAMHRGMLFYPT